MKKIYLSFPIEGRTSENILKTIEIMSIKAKELWGEDVTIISSYINPKDLKSEEYQDYMSDTLKKRWPQLARFEKLVQCDCMITFDSIFQDKVCQVEKELGELWKLDIFYYPNWGPIKDYETMLFGDE